VEGQLGNLNYPVAQRKPLSREEAEFSSGGWTERAGPSYRLRCHHLSLNIRRVIAFRAPLFELRQMYRIASAYSSLHKQLHLESAPTLAAGFRLP
jgi:hypothetical protein